MNDLVRIAGCEYALTGGVDISIALNFNGPQPNAYGVAGASSEACRSGELVGDTRLGGSCNFEQYTFVPHCTGTHTECIGHITRERISVRDCLRDVFVPAALVSVPTQNASQCVESYAVEFGDGDNLITRTGLQTALSKFGPLRGAAQTAGIPNSNEDLREDQAGEQILTALIVRTLPNDDAKLTRRYEQADTPYFTTDAMRFIVEYGFKHMLVDLPSIDRLYDDGRLANHRIFWNVAAGSFELTANSRTDCTITELIFVPNETPDGQYLLNLQIAPFAADASPSRPVIFRRVMP